jgi:hypothetical protein
MPLVNDTRRQYLRLVCRRCFRHRSSATAERQRQIKQRQRSHRADKSLRLNECDCWWIGLMFK